MWHQAAVWALLRGEPAAFWALLAAIAALQLALCCASRRARRRLGRLRRDLADDGRRDTAGRD